MSRIHDQKLYQEHLNLLTLTWLANKLHETVICPEIHAQKVSTYKIRNPYNILHCQINIDMLALAILHFTIVREEGWGTNKILCVSRELMFVLTGVEIQAKDYSLRCILISKKINLSNQVQGGWPTMINSLLQTCLLTVI